MNRFIYILFCIATIGCADPISDTQHFDYPINPVPTRDVVINDHFWLPKIKTIQDSTIHYALKKCEEEGRMENFLIAGKKKSGKTHGQMPFDDTDLYKIVEGASNTLISKPNPVLEMYLDSIIEIIKIGQEPDGYLTTWITIDRMTPPAPWVKTSEKRWGALGYSHELYNSGHLYEAAATHYLATGKRNFLDIAIKNADLLLENFGPGKLQTPPGHQIVETGLIRLYRITGNDDYLELARYFLDLRGDSAMHQLFGDYAQDHLPVTEQKEAVGHAVRAVYMYAAMTDIAALYQDQDYLKAVNTIWENIVNKKLYLTGGIGARHDGEAFGENYELPDITAYSETCAAIGSIYWNQRMFLLTGESKYYDVIERTLYNGMISGISVNGKKFFYPNPLESDGEYQFNKGSCTRSPWFDCSCCPTNLIRFIPSIPGLIYATEDDSLYVNLYVSNRSKIHINNQKVEVSLQTGYPWNGKISIAVLPENKSTFILKLRVPGWAQNRVVPGDLYKYEEEISPNIVLLINGNEEPVIIKDGYLEINREWHKGDKMELNIPMHVRKVRANKNVENYLNKVAFEYGPIVYCAEEIDNPDLSNISIPANESLTVSEANLFSNRVNILSGNDTGYKLDLIPYYLWSNREIGKMKVWFPSRIE